MKKIRALIIDDERLARDELRLMLKEFAEINIIGEAANADQAERMISNLRPDVIFLDIQMPVRSGFDLLEALPVTPLIVFITAYETYALKAFEVSAIDYLKKPVREERLKKAISEVKLRFKESENDHLFVKDKGQYHIINWSEVYLIESLDNYVRIYFGHKNILFKSSLNQLEERIDNATFFRIARAQLINLNYIKSITQQESSLSVKLKSGQHFPVSIRQAAKLKNLYNRK
ncbi:LytR/AlgR family response regulator transcription factor [Pedobacter antarcticus]|uniref:LytR/AlgR family response regulator transcription factor n=1 Tax=Pedobacter antarcticus TaxID=34086 RepID=UPI00292F204A|nr:response regulator [Pedobacter antarcticus]